MSITHPTIAGPKVESTDYYADHTITAGSVTPAQIAATGTPGSTTALFGDGTWKAPGGGGSDLVQTYAGSGSVYIPGLRGSPDQLPASPNAHDDEFEALSGWTTLGTLDVDNVTDVASNLHIKRTNTGADVNGIYKTAPSTPFTVTAKILTSNIATMIGHRSVGIMISDSGPTKMLLVDFDTAGGTYYQSARIWTNRTTFSGSQNDTALIVGTSVGGSVPMYVRAVVTSTSSVALWVSANGILWTNTYTSNPGLSAVSYVGLVLSDPVDGSGNTVDAYFDWLRFT